MPAAGNAEQARQLGHHDGQAGAGLEPDEDAVADELDQRAQPQGPRKQAKQGHGEPGEAGDLPVAHRIAPRHLRDRAGEHERDGRGRPDRQLT